MSSEQQEWTKTFTSFVLDSIAKFELHLQKCSRCEGQNAIFKCDTCTERNFFCEDCFKTHTTKPLTKSHSYSYFCIACAEFKHTLMSCKTCIRQKQIGQHACADCQKCYLHFKEVGHEFDGDTESLLLNPSAVTPLSTPVISLTNQDSSTTEMLTNEGYDDGVSQSVQHLFILR